MIEHVKYASLSAQQKADKRREYAVHQEGRCLCGNPLIGPARQDILDFLGNAPDGYLDRCFPGGWKAFIANPIHLDHDHATGLTRAVLHAECNAYEWLLEQWEKEDANANS